MNSINNWLHTREARFIIDDESTIKRSLFKGLPQGAVFSPLLYNIYTNDIAYNLPKQICQVQFADDIAIWISSNSFDNRKGEIERAIDTICSNLGKIGLDLQPKKTKLVDFGKIGLTGNNTKVRCIKESITIKKRPNF